MSKAPEPAAPLPEDLDAIALPATVRSAPRFGRFIGTGFWAGALLGVALGLFLPGKGADYRGVATLLTALGLALAGALVGGLAAAMVDHPARHAASGTRPASGSSSNHDGKAA